MARDLVMPQLGLTMTEGKVLRWYKQAGESFAAGEPLFEVETDKVNMDVEASEAGQLREIAIPLNEVVPVGAVIATYLPAGEQTATAAASAPDREARVPVSPRARAAARKLGLDLGRVPGSGPGGRIVEQDVLRAAEARPSASPAPAAPTGPAAPRPPETAGLVPLTRLRRIAAERMTESFRSAPHFYLTREVDASALLAVKGALAPVLAKRGFPELTITDLLLKAMALAIGERPEVNASWVDGQIHRHTGIAIGVAVSLEEGLIVPVLRNVEALGIAEIVRRRSELVERARSGHLKAGDLEEASATLTNLGMHGVDQFQPILNPPESLIVATGRIRDRVVAINGAPAVRPTMFCTVAADHRVLDGALAARFLASFAELLENPGLLLLPAAD